MKGVSHIAVLAGLLGACASLTAAEAHGPIAQATTAAEVVQAISEQVGVTAVSEPSDGAYARALAAVDGAHLGPAELQRLHLAQAEAWLAARDLNAAGALLGQLAEQDLLSAERLRYGSAQLLHWELSLRLQVAPLFERPEALQPVQLYPPTLLARAAQMRAEQALGAGDVDAAIAAYDDALAYVFSESPAERVALFGLRLLAMEERGDTPVNIQEYFAQFPEDPAARAVAAQAFSAADEMVGQQTPVDLSGPALRGDRMVSVAEVAKNAPVLLYYFQHGSRRCAEFMPMLVQLQREQPAGLQIVGISLDEHPDEKVLTRAGNHVCHALWGGFSYYCRWDWMGCAAC